MILKKSKYNFLQIPIEKIDTFSTHLIMLKKRKDIRPLIFTGSIKHWNAAKKWDLDYFKSQYGDILLETAHDFPTDLSPYLFKEEPHHIKNMTLNELITLISENKPCYAAQSDHSLFEGLESEYNFNDLIPKLYQGMNIQTNFWIGANTRSGLHFDYNDNFLAQVHGSKLVYLAAPEEAKNLYPLPENYTKTQVNPMNPDFDRYPKLKNAKFYVGEINAGDVLFIPKGWYHYIYAPSQSISLNCWYGPFMTASEMLLSFFRSGVKTWLEFAKGFYLYGIKGQQFPGRLFSSYHMGQLAHENLTKIIFSNKANSDAE